MSVRQAMNRYPRITTAVAILATAAALVGIGTQMFGGGGGSGSPHDAFFTVDDGQTWFSASAANLAPFEHEGRQAVRAYLFQCGGKPFVAYLERYTPDARKTIQEIKAAGPATKPSAAAFGLALNPGAGREIKRPGEKAWRPASDPNVRQAIMPRGCPNASDALEAYAP